MLRCPALAVLLLATLASAQKPAAPTDPVARLAKLPPLAGVRWTADTRFPPIVVVLPAGGDPTKGFAGRCGAWTGALARFFARDIAGEHAPPEDWRLIIAVTNDEELFAACRQAAGVRDARDEQAFYAPAIGAVLVRDRIVADDAASIAEAMRAPLHAAVHALLAASAAKGAAPPLWLTEGLAERLSANTGFEPVTAAALRARDDDALVALLADFRDPVRRPACLRPLAELTALSALADLDARLARMTADPAVALRGVARQAELLLAWLDDTGGGAPAGLGARLVPQSLELRAGTSLIPPAEAAALDAPFSKWLLDIHRTRLPNEDARGFTLAPASAGAGEVEAGVAARPADLAPPPGDTALAHAQALRLAMDGDLRGALLRLDALIAAPGALPADEARRLPVERRVLAQLADLRHRWLLGRVGKPVDLPEGAKTARYVLTELRGDVLVLADPRGGKSERPESALLPGALAVLLQGSGIQPTAADDEARALAWVLATDAGWKERTAALARADVGPPGRAVMEWSADVDRLARIGRATDRLAALAARKLPLDGATEPERDGWLAATRELLADEDLAVVAERAVALRALAEQVLGARFDADPLATLALGGKVETPRPGRLRITWDFNTAAPWKDWSTVAPDVAVSRKALQAKRPPGDTLCGVQDHWLVLRGEAQWRSAVGLQAPITAEWDLVFRLSTEEAALAKKGGTVAPQKVEDHFDMRFCGDGRGAGLAVRDFGTLIRNDPSPSKVDTADSWLPNLQLDKTYHMRLDYDGKHATMVVENQVVAELDANPPRGGSYLEMWHDTGRPIALRRLVVEGARDATTLSQGRAAWLKEQVAGLSKKK